MNELKGSALMQVNPIEKRANSKIVTFNNRHFLVGGMTADAVSNQILEFRINHQHQPPKLEWKAIHFTNNLFSPRNSFAACAGRGMIYIWGGLQMLESDQKCLSDLIEIDIEKGKMRLLPLKQKVNIHSSSLVFDQQNNQLIAFGGSDENSNLPAFLYKLNLSAEGNQYEWVKTKVKCPEEFIWQHSSTLSSSSFFGQQKGKFLTVVGGCRFPHSPYKSLVQINLQTNLVTQQLLIDQGLASHDSVERDNKLYIFGGSNGGDFNNIIYVLQKGKIKKLKGHKAIGCCCCLIENKMLVYGGVSGPATINGACIYQ